MIHETLRDYYDALPGGLQTAILFVLVAILGYLILKLLHNYADDALRHTTMDNTLQLFLVRVIDIGGWIVLGIVLLSVAGIDPAGLLGGLAIGGFVIGFALKDTLGNLAAGVMLLVYRPFNVGDTVSMDGVDGDIRRLGMGITEILTADGRIATLPNGRVLGHTIINHTREATRRADVLVGIGYDDDINTAVKAILEAVNADKRVLTTPEPSVRISSLGDSSVNLQVRPWVRTEDYWQTKADLNATVKSALEAAGCSIPFPQRDLHIVSGKL